jgi:hypothetical protein
VDGGALSWAGVCLYSPQATLAFVFEGTVSRDFLLQVFFMNHLPQAPENNASEGAPPVSTSSAVNLPPIFRKKSKRFTQGLGFMMIYEKT